MKNDSFQQPRRPGEASRTAPRRRQRGFTMFEVLLVVVALGLLAALIIPTVDRFFDATGDTAKTHNAQVLNQYMETLFNAGVDTSAWTDAAAAIDALKSGVSIAATVPGGQTLDVKLKQEINPRAYQFTAGSALKPPTFTPILGNRRERP